MRYQKFPPHKDLGPFVECYYVWQGEARTLLDVQSPAFGYCAMVFNYGDTYKAYQNKEEVKVVPRAFISGQFTSNFHLLMKGVISTVGIVFKPTAPNYFFGIRMSHLVNNRMALSLLLDKEIDKLLPAIKHQATDTKRVEILENFLLSRLSEAKSHLSIVDEAVEFIDINQGCSTVDEVATYLKVSRRYLEKKFLETVGVSPKFYARIKRFGILSNRISHSEKIDWQQIVFEHGFHDQSHLAKEFTEFNKMNPSTYVMLHNEMTRFLKKR
ncbi:MAG: helix-turn-helix domain-containing protein [Bacteroidota bacterium]